MAGGSRFPLGLLSTPGTIALLNAAFGMAGSPDKLPRRKVMIAGIFGNGSFYQSLTSGTGAFLFA